jgi:hypothetical protein
MMAKPWIGLAAMLFIVGTITACTTAQPYPTLPVQVPPSSNAEHQAFEEAMQAFEDEEYQKASAIFEFLSDSTHSEELYRQALYGMACSRLAAAQTAAELDEAIDLWVCWSQQAPDRLEGEDPRLLTPLLQRLDPPEQNLPKGSKRIQRKPSSNSDHLALKDLAMYKNLLQAKEKELEKVKARLDSREREVRRLKHQIDSLEAIHLKYQEKKKEISTP